MIITTICSDPFSSIAGPGSDHLSLRVGPGEVLLIPVSFFPQSLDTTHGWTELSLKRYHSSGHFVVPLKYFWMSFHSLPIKSSFKTS